MSFKKPKFNLIDWIKKRIKRLRCNHYWKTKNNNAILCGDGFYYYTTHRCIKCGKIEDLFIKTTY